MSTTAVTRTSTSTTEQHPVEDLKLEAIVIPVSDVDDEIAAHGVEVSDVFHPVEPGAQFVPGSKSGRVAGVADEAASYGSFATFADPDGNTWLLQEVTARLPGRTNTAAEQAGIKLPQ